MKTEVWLNNRNAGLFIIAYKHKLGLYIDSGAGVRYIIPKDYKKEFTRLGFSFEKLGYL
jgi:hypothetical protein